MSTTDKIQVLVVIDSLRHGGAEKSLVSQLRYLDYSRIDVDLYVRSRGGVHEASLPPHVTFVDYSPRGVRKVLLKTLHSLAIRQHSRGRHGAETEWGAIGALYPAPRKKYDVAIAYQQGVPTFFVCRKVKAARKIAWINADLAAAGYDAAYCSKFYASMDSVVAVSATLSRKIAADGYCDDRKMLTIYDIIDTGAIYNAATLHCDMTPIPDNTLRFVTVARLSSPKNHILAVQAAAILKQRGLKFVWHFVGDGPERAAIADAIQKAGLEGCIILEGAKENPYPYFAAADIYVQTSSFEGFGITLAEARLLGRPVVTTDFAVARDQITDGYNGLIAEMTPESVADKILLLAGNKSLRQSIGAQGAAEINITADTESQKVNDLICEK
ncbi:MAG: glycosyltransferase [Muribaculaceae bacterium]|nr:glycosyltransferase [Muribaculaceae bacterium]